MFGNCAAWENVERKRRERRVVRMSRDEGRLRIVIVCYRGGRFAQERSFLFHLYQEAVAIIDDDSSGIGW